MVLENLLCEDYHRLIKIIKEMFFTPGYTVGYLEQEPILDDSKTVIEIVREGVAETMAVLDEFNKINDGLWFYLKFMKMPIRWSN
jgi:hypothetical protein